MTDDRPERSKAKPGLAVDRFDPSLAHQGILPGAVALDPMTQKHPDCAALIPGQEVLRAFDSGIVPAKRPDASAHARDRPASALLDHGEGVLAEQIPEREVRRRAGDSPANRPSKGGSLAEPNCLCRVPQSIGVGFGGAAMEGTYLRVGQPLVEVGVHGSSEANRCAPGTSRAAG